MREAICARCDRSLAGIASGQPCPNCGSTGRKGSITVTGAVRVSGHLTAVGIRKGKPFAFSETENRELTRYAHLEPDGTVRLDLKGLAPQNEQDSEFTCKTLVEALRAGGVEMKLLGQGQADEDFVVSIRGERLGVQVVRAISNSYFWWKLATEGQVGPVRVKVAVVNTGLRAAIELKSSIPPRQRDSLILLLDAYRVPAVALGDVAAEFARVHGSWAEGVGFRAIYLVGPSAKFVHQLAGGRL